MEIIFNTPIYLFGLLSVPALIIIHLLTESSKRAVAIQFANFATIARLSKRGYLPKNITLLIVRCITLVFITLAVAGTTLFYTGQTNNFSFIITIDSSSSMLSQDFAPNRLEAAKEATLNFVEDLSPGNLVGILSFAGTTKIEQTLTYDKFLVKEGIRNIDFQTSGGTDLGAAIITGTNLFFNGANKSKTLILVTDGRSNIGADIEEAIDYANNKGVNIYTVGVGKLEKFEEEINFGLDEEALKDIAVKTGGVYFNGKDIDELNKAFKDVTKISVRKIPVDLTRFLLFLALVLSLLDWVLMKTKFKRVP